MKRPYHAFCFALAAAIAGAMSVSPARAAITWASAAATDWSASASWTGGVPAGSADVADFSVNPPTNPVDLTTNRSVLGLIMKGKTLGLANTTLTLTLGSSGLVDSTSAVTFNAQIIANANQPWTFAGGNTNFLNGGLVDNGFTITINNGGSSIELAKALSGSGSIVYNRPSQRFQLDVANNYTGTITVTRGFLSLKAAGFTGLTAGNITVADNNYVAGVATPDAISNTFLTNVAALNIPTLATGSIVIALEAASSNALDFSGTAGGVSMANASLGAVTGQTYSGTLTPNGTTYRLGGGGSTLTMSGPLTGASNSLIIVANTVTLTPTIANTMGGTITVNNSATLNASTFGIGSASGLTLTGGTTLGTTGSDLAISAPITIPSGNVNLNTGTNNMAFSGAVTGGMITLSGNGTVTLSGAADNPGLSATVSGAGTLVLSKTSSATVHAINGGITLSGTGTLQLGNNSGDQIADTQNITFSAVGTFDLHGFNEGVNTIGGASAGIITDKVASTISTLTLGTNNGSGSFPGVIQNGLGTVAVTKVGTGTQTFTGVNNYTGGTNLQAGTLAVGVANALPATGTIKFGSATTNGTLDLGAFNQQVAGLSIDPGVPSGSNASQVIGSSSTTVAPVLTYAGNSTFAGVIKDKLAAGTKTLSLAVTSGNLTLLGPNTYTGGSTVSGTATLTFSGAGSRPATGTLTLGADATPKGGTINLLTGETLSQVQAELVAATIKPATGAAALNQTVGFLTTDQYNTFHATTLTTGGVTLKYTWFGDINLDGQVTLQDYRLADAGYLLGFDGTSGHVATWLNGDVTGLTASSAPDGIVDFHDFAAMNAAMTAEGSTVLAQDIYALNVSQFGAPYAAAYGADLGLGAGPDLGAVPEPMSLGFLGLGVAGLLLRRRGVR